MLVTGAGDCRRAMDMLSHLQLPLSRSSPSGKGSSFSSSYQTRDCSCRAFGARISQPKADLEVDITTVKVDALARKGCKHLLVNSASFDDSQCFPRLADGGQDRKGEALEREIHACKCR